MRLTDAEAEEVASHLELAGGSRPQRRLAAAAADDNRLQPGLVRRTDGSSRLASA